MSAIFTVPESGWPADPLAHLLDVLKLLGAESPVGAPSASALGRALARTRTDVDADEFTSREQWNRGIV